MESSRVHKTHNSAPVDPLRQWRYSAPVRSRDTSSNQSDHWQELHHFRNKTYILPKHPAPTILSTISTPDQPEKSRLNKTLQGGLVKKGVTNVGSKKSQNDIVFPEKYLQKFHPQCVGLDKGLNSSGSLRNGSATCSDIFSNTDESDSEDDNGERRRRFGIITANLSATRYEVVADAAFNAGFRILNEDETDSFLFWNDAPYSIERITELKPYQWANHFPGMGEICRKDFLARNIAKMARIYPADFNFVPKTWIMPAEHMIWHNYAHGLRQKKMYRTYIRKPVNGAMGNGICLIGNLEKAVTSEQCIIQEYIDKPFLMDGYKCDMRIYVLVTSCDPLRVHLFHNGLLRMGTEKYSSPSDDNLDHHFMHLTNFAINRHSENYQADEDASKGSKRSLEYFRSYLKDNGYNVDKIWQDIADLILKTLIVALPQVFHAYRMCRAGDGPGADSVCFEILGFDILLDHKLKPWLIEVNRSPSFETKQMLDYDVKLTLLEEAFKMLNIRAKDKKKQRAVEKAEATKRLTTPIKRGHMKTTNAQLEKQKQELTALLQRVTRDEKRDTHECRHAGHYRRIFPSLDQSVNQRYNEFITDAFRVFQHEVKRRNWASGATRDMYNMYKTDLKSYEIMDLISESDTKVGEAAVFNMILDKPVSKPPVYHSTILKPVTVNSVNTKQQRR